MLVKYIQQVHLFKHCHRERTCSSVEFLQSWVTVRYQGVRATRSFDSALLAARCAVSWRCTMTSSLTTRCWL